MKVSTRLTLSLGLKACTTAAERLGKKLKSPKLLMLSWATLRVVATVPRVRGPLIPTSKPGLIVERKLLTLSVGLMKKLSLYCSEKPSDGRRSNGVAEVCPGGWGAAGRWVCD